MSIETFRELLGVIEFGLEHEDKTKRSYIVTIRTMDVLLGVLAAVVIYDVL